MQTTLNYQPNMTASHIGVNAMSSNTINPNTINLIRNLNDNRTSQ
jgi:hypothetical protein